MFVPSTNFSNETTVVDNLLAYMFSSSAVALAIFGTVCVASVLMNSIVLVVICRLRGTLSPALKFAASLAVSDMWTSTLLTVTMFLKRSFAYSVVDLAKIQCVVMTLEAFRIGGMLSACAHLVAIAINHYLLISGPLFYYQIFTRANVWAIVTALWIVPTAAVLTYLSSVPEQGFRSPNGLCSGIAVHSNLYYRISISSFIFGSVIVVFVTYVLMLIRLRNRQTETAELPNKVVRERLKQRRQMLTAIFYMWLALVVGWIPTCIYTTVFCASCPLRYILERGDAARFQTGLFVTASILFKCAVNPLICTYRIPEVAAGCKRLFRVRNRNEERLYLSTEAENERLSTISKASVDRWKSAAIAQAFRVPHSRQSSS